MSHLHVAGGSLAVREWGDPDGRSLIFLHALGSATCGAYLAVSVEPLIAAGYRLIAPDLPGFGRSPAAAPGSYAVTSLAAMISSMTDALGLDRFGLVGHSWGGTIACRMVKDHPDRVDALVLADTGHRDWGDTEPEILALDLPELVRRSEEYRLRVADRSALAAASELAEDDLVVDALMEGLEDDGAGGLVSRTTAAVRGEAMYWSVRSRPSEAWPTIASAGIPTLLLLATVPDEIRAANERDGPKFQAVIPNAEVGYVEGVNHSMITDMRADFGSLAAGWLARLA